MTTNSAKHIIWLYCPLLSNVCTAQLEKFRCGPFAFVIKQEEVNERTREAAGLQFYGHAFSGN